MQVNSFSQPDTTYNVTIKDRRAIDCDCPSHYHGKKRNPFHTCKHMRFVTQQYREVECDEAQAEHTLAEEKRTSAVLNNANKGFSLL